MKTDYHIRYEWEMKRQALDFEIAKVQSQLASANKRLHMLHMDVWVYLGFLLVPLLLNRICNFIMAFVPLFTGCNFKWFTTIYFCSLPYLFTTKSLLFCENTSIYI